MQVTDERHFRHPRGAALFRTVPRSQPPHEESRVPRLPESRSRRPALERRAAADRTRVYGAYGLRRTALFRLSYTRTSNVGISISCRCAWGSTAASWRTTSRRGGRGRSSMLWNDATVCALPPRATRSRRTTRCRNSTIRKATSNDNSHRSCALHCTVTAAPPSGSCGRCSNISTSPSKSAGGTAHGHEYAGYPLRCAR